MNEQEAQKILSAADELVPCTQGSMMDMKRLRDRCLDTGIAAVVFTDEANCKTGCAPKIQLLVQESDLPAVAKLMGSEWVGHFHDEDLEAARATHAAIQRAIESGAEHDPCPACGTAAPLVDGACSDCGLTLE